jgi:hypothetical protein
MSEYTVPDCLVLKLEEVEERTNKIDTRNNKIDTTLYILYDSKKQHYVLRGQRRVSVYYDSCSYSFICKCENELVDFLEYIICKYNLVNETLYNYDNLSHESNNITFEFLKKHEDKDNELSGYNNDKPLKRNKLLKTLRMLKNVFNYYN